MRILTLIAILFFGFSCKKDKLEDGKEIFIGKWNWVYTDHEYYICIGMPQEEVLTPETEHRNYSMEFFEKGIVKFFENENVVKRYRLVYYSFGESSLNYGTDFDSFGIYFNNNLYDKDYYLQGAISSDTLVVIRGFPFQDSEEGCERHISYFVKE